MREVEEWLGKTDDAAVPNRVKLRVFALQDGRCAKCTRKLVARHWECDHIVALINGGENREKNLQPLCDVPCHSTKTKADVGEKSRTYYVRARHAGLKKRKRSIPGRRFNGTPIPPRWNVTCPKCGASMLHVDWGSDLYAPDHKLLDGQGFWRDGTPDEAEVIMRRRIEQMRDKYPCTPAKEAELIKMARSEGNEGEFQKGWPMLSRAT